MSPWMLYGGIAAAGLAAWYFMGNAAPASDGEGESMGGPILYNTGGGYGMGQVTGNTATDSSAALAAALSKQSDVDLSLGLARINAEYGMGMADINADVTLGLGAQSLTLQKQTYEATSNFAKLGISAVGTTLNPAGGFSTSVLYSDPSLNVALASGYNARGDLIGNSPIGPAIIAQSSQSALDFGKYTDLTGVTQYAQPVLVGSKNNIVPKPAATPAPTVHAQSTTPRVNTGINRNRTERDDTISGRQSHSNYAGGLRIGVH